MRALLAQPRRKLGFISSANLPGIAHWQMEDSATTSVVDGYGNSNLTATTTTTVTAPIYNAAASAFGLGRDPSTALPSGASTSGQRTSLLGDITIEATVNIASLTTDAQTIVVHRATGGASTSNALAWFGTRSTGALYFRHEHGTKVLDEVDSPAGAVTTGLHHLAARRKNLASGCIVSLFVDGKNVANSFLANQTFDGSLGLWVLGAANTGGTLLFSGQIYECRVLAVAASATRISQDAARALRTWDTDKVIRSQNYQTFARVLVEDVNTGGTTFGLDCTMADIDNLASSASWEGHGYEFLQSASITEDIDQPGATADLELMREVFDWSLAPGIASSPVQLSVSKVLALARRIQIETAIVPYGVDRSRVQPWEWVNVFDGFISSVDWGENTIKIQARDMVAPLQNTFCRPLASNNYQEKVYGDDTTGVALETVIQSIINDHVPASGMLGGTPILYTPSSPAWNLRRRSIGFETLYDVISNKADQIGYVCRYKWDDNYKQTRLTLYQPQRTSPTVLRTFAVNEYISLDACSVNEENIRNVCEVVYTDRTAGADTINMQPRARYVSSDSTSISSYGERYCQIAEDMASQIDTATEAQKLADSVVQDLSEPRAIASLSLAFFPFVELDDYYTITADGLHFDTNQSLAVTTIKHTLDGKGSARTVLSMRGNPAGGVDKHHGNIVGVAAPYAPFLPPDAPSSVTLTPGDRRATITWPWPTSLVSRAFDSAEVHMTTASGAWTPSSSTLMHVTRTNKAIIPELTYGTTYQCKVLFRDRKGNVTTTYDAGSFSPTARKDDQIGSWLTKRLFVAQQQDNATTLSTFGLSSVTEASAGAAKTTLSVTGPPGGNFIRYTCPASLRATDGGVHAIGQNAGRAAWLPKFSARIRTPPNMGQAAWWCGLFASNPGGIDPGGLSSTVQGFGFGASNGSDLLFNSCNGVSWSGASYPMAALGDVSGVGQSVILDLECGFSAAGTLYFVANGINLGGLGNVTGASNSLDFYCCVRNIDNSGTRAIDIGRLAMSTDY